MTREELAQEIEEFLKYINALPNSDNINTAMTEVALGGFAIWLHGRAEKESESE